MVGDNFKTRLIHWPKTYRIISSRYPPIDIFEKVASPEEFEDLYYLESLTNDRLRNEVGDIDLVPVEDRLYGPGTGAIMAAFTHINPYGSRFSDGSYGVYYCAKSLETAIAETSYHVKKMLIDNDEPEQVRQMRVYVAGLAAEMVEAPSSLRNPVYKKTDYTAGQAFGSAVKKAGGWGIVYNSVRHENGQCAAVFRPQALRNCVQSIHLQYIWDTKKIDVKKM